MTAFDATLADVQACPDGSVLLTTFVPAADAEGLKRGDVVRMCRDPLGDDQATIRRLCELIP